MYLIIVGEMCNSQKPKVINIYPVHGVRKQSLSLCERLEHCKTNTTNVANDGKRGS